MEELSNIDLGILAHEAFHAFKANFIELKERYKPQKRWMNLRSKILYRNIPQLKRAVVLEEAYAVLIGSIIIQHRSLSKLLARHQNSDEEKCLGTVDLAMLFWENDWKAPIKGYYYRDSVQEYWADRAKGFWNFLHSGHWDISDEPLFVDQSLTPMDRRWISETIFEGTLTSSFENTFQNELESMPCSPTN